MKDFNMHLNLGQGDLPRISVRYLVHFRLAKLSRVDRGNRETISSRPKRQNGKKETDGHLGLTGPLV